MKTSVEERREELMKLANEPISDATKQLEGLLHDVYVTDQPKATESGAPEISTTMFGEFGIPFDVINSNHVSNNKFTSVTKKKMKKTTLQEINDTKKQILGNKKEALDLDAKLSRLLDKAKKEVEILNKEISKENK